MSEKRHYIVYRTTCLKNGKYYIGCHSTNNLNDGYLGSGVELLRDVARFGKSAFVRETLYECSSKQEAASKEREVVNREVVNDPNSYNKHIGGGVRGAKIGVSKEFTNCERYRNEHEYRERKLKYQKNRYHTDTAYRERMKEQSKKYGRERRQNDPAFMEQQREYKRKKFSDPIYRELKRESDRFAQRKCRNKKRFKQKLTTSTDFCLAFVLRCKANATLLQKTLELFKNDADFCELLRNLVEK